MERWITDTEPSERYPLVSRANAGEVYPDPITPLSASLMMLDAGEQGWRDAYVESGAFDYDEFDRDTTNTIASYGGYLFINMSLTRIYGVRMPGLTPELVDFTYFGDMPGIPSYESEARPTDDSAEHAARLERYLVEDLIGRTEIEELAGERALVERIIAGRPDFAGLDDRALIDNLRSLTPVMRPLFCRHILVSGGSGVGIGIVAGVLAAVGEPELVMTLIAGLGEVDSAAPSYALWELSRLVNASPALSEAFDAGVAGLAERVAGLDDPAAERFRAGFADFLLAFGSRGPNEWELRSDTWGTRPELALTLVDRMRGAADDESPAARNRLRVTEREDATAKIRAILDGNAEAAGQFEVGLLAAHVFNAGRERSKTTCILLLHEMRLLALELGRRLVEAGHLDTVEQVFMFTDDDLDTALAAPAEAGAVARAREPEYLALYDLEPPFVIAGPPPPLDEWARKGGASEPARPGDVLTGIPGCPGVATGTARIVTDPADPSALQAGEILIAPITDPAWTPLFVPSKAVVVDVGAQISHAVIVSRELGLPCVVSVTGATKRIPDGATITVDGTAGTVTIVAVP